MAALAQNVPKSPRSLAWFPQFLRQELAPYPGRFETGKKIDGLTGAEQITGVKVLHAGTKRVGGEIVTSGGRVLGVTAIGPTLGAALGSAYAAADKIHFDGMHYRRDIGRHLNSLKATGN